MTRVLFWFLIGVLLVAGLRKLASGRQGGGASAAAAPRTGAAENMVRCRVCGLNLPQSEALQVGAQWACCAQHAREPAPGGSG